MWNIIAAEEKILKIIPTLREVRHLRPSMEAIFNGMNQGLSENQMLEMAVSKGASDMLVDQRIIFNGGNKGLDSYYIDKKELHKFGVQDYFFRDFYSGKLHVLTWQ